MVRFSCFQGHVHSNKPKKNVQLSPDSIQKMSGVSSTDKALKGFTSSGGTNSSHLKVQEGIYNNSIVDVTNSSYAKSEDIGSKYDSESEFELNKTGRIIKSKSLGSGLDQKGKISCSNSDDEIDRGFSGDGSHDSGGSAVPSGHCQALLSESLRVISDKVNDLSIFSIGDLEQSEKEDRVNSSVEGDGESNDPTPLTPPVIVKSKSLSNLGSYGRSSSAHFKPLSTCSEDLNLSESRLKVRFIHAITAQEIQDQERDDTVLNGKKNNCENSVDRGKYADDCTNSAKDRIIPMKLESNVRTAVRGEPSVFRLSDLPGEDFKIKRIEEWVMDLQQGGPPEGTDELLTSSDDGRLRAETVLHNSTTARLDNKAIPGMEASKKYISSLSASATAAQLSNRGLLLIPVLSAFVSLRVLNLSGNSVVRITAGALPRGLHVLNLSKNHISTIEGLRELTRLRVLDLSYNRILKIGHGLSYCSSLKELYLAGNKISEVEGLHRLLKLNVLDLRFNKISTTKCLGQLAANYNSLHALSLEGNPAHKNVGDEQLKKFVLALLPHLAYFNRQSIKPGCSKDGPDRSARLGITSHQTDRSLRSELKTRRGSHGRRSEAVTTQKTSRGKYGKIPLGGIKTANQRHHFYDFGGKLLNFTPDLSIHRSRSAGNLAAL